ncbi:MAG TPA: tRNA pseudouridine(55) synthase, partial [bacterium]
LPEFSLCLECSSGFYVRSLAHDIGQSLGCGAILSSLIRTRIGDHRLEDAWGLEDIERIFKTREPSRATCPN